MIAAEPLDSLRLLDTISIGEVVLAVAGLGVMAAALRKIWPIARRLAVLADAAEWLPEVRSQVETIHHQVTPNGGGSMKDALHRVESRGTENAKAIKSLSRRLDQHIDRDQGDHS